MVKIDVIKIGLRMYNRIVEREQCEAVHHHRPWSWEPSINVAAGMVVVSIRLPFPVGFLGQLFGFFGGLFEGYISVRCRCYNHWPVGRLDFNLGYLGKHWKNPRSFWHPRNFRISHMPCTADFEVLSTTATCSRLQNRRHLQFQIPYTSPA